ncbi:MAG: WG repeat-containing protein, partial [Rikenellaceae bacterium]
AELDKTIGSNFSYVIDYVFNGKGDFHASVDCINKSLKIGDDRIEQLCHKMSLSNHYFNSENYDTSYGKSENRVVVRDMKTNKFGYTDSYGNLVIDFIFDEVTHFNEGIAVVGIGKHYYAIDNSGEQLSKKSYDAIQWYSDINRFIVQRGNHYMLLNRAFEQISKHDYIWIGEFSSNRAVVERANNSRKGYIDLDANEITPISYDDALSFENGLGKVLFEGIWHVVTFDGDVI